LINPNGMIYIYLIYPLSVIVLVLVILKTFLFFSSTSNPTLQNWFFFSSYAMYNSRNEKRRKRKLFQNKLTVWIIFFVLSDAIVYLFFH